MGSVKKVLIATNAKCLVVISMCYSGSAPASGVGVGGSNQLAPTIFTLERPSMRSLLYISNI